MMRNAGRPGAARSPVGEWDGATWDRLLARWAGYGGVGDSDALGRQAPARPDVFVTGSGFPAVIDLATLDGSNGFRIDGVRSTDTSGTSVSSAGDVNGDGIGDFIIGSRGDPGGDREAGRSYVVFGNAEGFGASFDLSRLGGSDGFRIAGVDAGDYSGQPVSSAGDVNGDGFDDVIIGAARADPGGDTEAGESYVVFGKAGGFSGGLDLASLNGFNGFRIDGIDVFDSSGRSVSSAGDVNGDGFDDIIIGAPDADPGGDSEAGESYVVFGKTGGFAASISLASLDGSNGFRIDGVDAFDSSGFSVSSAGDVNGDGFDDLIIGAFVANSGGDYGAGESYVVFGKADGFDASFNLAALDGNNGFRLKGVDEFDFSGFSVSAAGDVNGDGLDDIIIGTPGDDYGDSVGKSYVVFGKASGFAASLDLATLNGGNGFRIDGIDLYDYSGRSVSSAGDVNGDGFDDIIIGAYSADPGGDSSAGESYVVFGKAGDFAPSLDLATLDGSNGFRLDGVDENDRSGSSVSGAGDVNGDGFDDIIIGARLGDPSGVYNAGESYVVFGRAPDEAVRRKGSGADQTIRGGDFDDNLLGKGGNDLLAGGVGKDKLVGGADADDFLFGSLNAADADRIADFKAGTDQIALDGDIFGFPEGALNPSRFVSGAAAGDASDRLIYDGATGKLFFDADGTGAQAQVLIATLTGAPVLAASDFVVI